MNEEEEKEEISTFLQKLIFTYLPCQLLKILPLIKIHEPIWAHAV